MGHDGSRNYEYHKKAVGLEVIYMAGAGTIYYASTVPSSASLLGVGGGLAVVRDFRVTWPIRRA